MHAICQQPGCLPGHHHPESSRIETVPLAHNAYKHTQVMKDKKSQWVFFLRAIWPDGRGSMLKLMYLVVGECQIKLVWFQGALYIPEYPIFNSFLFLGITPHARSDKLAEVSRHHCECVVVDLLYVLRCGIICCLPLHRASHLRKRGRTQCLKYFFLK